MAKYTHRFGQRGTLDRGRVEPSGRRNRREAWRRGEKTVNRKL